MRVEAGLIKWNEVVTGNNVESDWSRLKKNFEQMRKKFIPFKNSKIKQCKWITRSVIKCRKAKNKAWVKFKESGNDPVAFTNYKEMQRRSQNIIRSAKRNFDRN